MEKQVLRQGKTQTSGAGQLPIIFNELEEFHFIYRPDKF